MTTIKQLKNHPAVKQYLKLSASHAGSVTSDRKKESSRRNGSAPVKPGSRPRGRPKVEQFGKLQPEVTP